MPEFDAHEYHGTCRVCGWSGRFVRDHRSMRETYACGNCRATLRYRVQAEAILAHFAGRGATTIRELAADPVFSSLRIFEPGVIGPFRRFLKPLPGYSMSFFWEDLKSGEMRDGVANEDLMDLSIPTASVDLMISSDIFEHIRHPDRGFAEVARILRPGGLHVFTVPTHVPMRESTTRRVDVSGAEDIHVLPEAYHGNGKGGRSLVYNDFGRDILDMQATAGLQASIHQHAVTEPIVCHAVAFVAVKPAGA